MKNDRIIQEIESTLNLLLCKMNENDYNEFIKDTAKVSENDSLMKNNLENSISEELLNEVKNITQKKLKEIL